MMRRLVVALLLVAAAIGTAGVVTASTTLGLVTAAVVGVAWLVHDFSRSAQGGAA